MRSLTTATSGIESTEQLQLRFDYCCGICIQNNAQEFGRKKKQHNIKYFFLFSVGLLCVSQVWIGLRFLGGSWWWADGNTVAQKWKLPSCPSERNHCGTLSHYGTRKWIIRDCSEKRNFICYKKLNRN